MTERAADSLDRIFRALASKPRREILALLASGAPASESRCCAGDEICACVFADRLGLSAPTVSHHMKALIGAGLVTSRKDGLWVHYRLRPEAITQVLGELGELLKASGCCGTPPKS